METCINYCTLGCAYVSSDERRWINRIRKLKEQHPEEVRIIREPENNDGCIYASVPVKWVRISIPVKKNLTDEQRDAIRERLTNSHKQFK